MTSRGRLRKRVGRKAVTVDDITERAGLGRATFFRHYRSKEDVWLGAMMR
jgi:AcrR family transcriptional regulator